MAWQREGLPVSTALEARLRALYAVPPRAYHNASHVDEVLARFDEARAGMRDPRVPFYALLFHDAIYVAGRKDNEEKSAQAFLAEGLVPDVAEKVRDVILATARHGRILPSEVDADTALALDCDMAILGASPERFAEYDAQIAEEYAGTVLYSFGRKKFVKGLLARERLYLSDFFHARFDAQARANLLSLV
jgi:predicted metal-dependent HD superfamily phosphohydrolase